ncbi:MAG: hypothetical protein ACXQTL_06135 [Methanosarcinales archaeon]
MVGRWLFFLEGYPRSLGWSKPGKSPKRLKRIRARNARIRRQRAGR